MIHYDLVIDVLSSQVSSLIAYDLRKTRFNYIVESRERLIITKFE